MKEKIIEKLKKIKNPAIIAALLGGSAGTYFYVQDTPTIEPSNIQRYAIANLETSTVDRATLAETEIPEVNSDVPETKEVKPEIPETKEVKPEIPEIKTKKTKKSKELPPRRLKKNVSKILTSRQFNDTDSPEPYDIYMKNNWDGNFLRAEGVNARFGKDTIFRIIRK